MNIGELIRSARRSAPNLAALADEDAQSLVREVFRQIRKEIDSTPEGKIVVGGLGLFRIKQGEREKDGRKTAVKRIAFQAAKSEGLAE